ncbi:MAG TPA: alpha/beta fold hydrolase [Planctomycetota bacterium]|nr:alpha/beta fold hydrolase [Planctomycetota bacterium]
MKPAARLGRLRIGFGLLALWLVLLVASRIYIAKLPAPSPPEGARAVAVALETAEGPVPGQTQLHLFEYGPVDAPKVLLLHGSPGSHHDFDGLKPLFEGKLHVYIPDLPGFGVLTQRLPDYSTSAHARYLLDWMEQEHIEGLHVVGFSMGGAVALHLWDLAPDRIRSLTLAAGLGVEEWELLGDHALNHALHGLLLGVVHTIDTLVPHFGAFDRFPVGIAHARNFFDSDQRLLRPILERIDVPVQILHGDQDILIPPGAAKEHARIVPQAELLMLPGQNHFLPWTATNELALAVEDFVKRVEAGAAASRAQADATRIERAQAAFDPRSIPEVSGFPLALMVLLLALSTLVSEDLTCLAAGWLVSQGRLGFFPATLGCFVGIVVGDLLLYILGRVVGRAALERRPLKRWVRPETLQSAADWLERRGIWVVFLSRFTPGLRLPTYLLAGALRTRFLAFAGFFALASAIWTPALVGLSAWLGERLLPRDADLSASLWRALPWLIGFWWLLRSVILPSFHHYGRRKLVGRWKRLTEFEYWPTWALYGPLIPYFVWQALRFRSATVFSAANPGMEGGGFAGESKGDILDGFGPNASIAPYLRLDNRQALEARMDAIERWQSERGIGFPLVLKPDVGERGKDVRIVRERETLEQALAACPGPYLIQQYVGGQEFGVFYRYDPERDEGQVVSITEKHLPQVVGDGTRTVGQLVLDDRRAVAMAAAYQRGLGGRWNEIPALGESVRIVEVGTHSRGSIFQNGALHHTPELVRAIDAISRRFRPLAHQPGSLRGLCLGRYDLKTPDAEHLRRGEDLHIIELNGVTSEPTHIYDARESLLSAWRTLGRQWRWAFELGAWQRSQGAKVDSVLGLWRLSRRRK